MNRARVGEVELEWEALGDPRDPPVVLVMGLGAQLVHWPGGFCRALVERGLRVVRFDNRDAGRSTRLDHLPPPSLPRLALGFALGRAPRPAYPLEAMADDVVGLLDALELPRAHVVGASMGGMIAQLVALRRRERVLSLVSIMSTPGGRDVPRLRALRALLARQRPGRDGAVERNLALFRVLAGDELPFDEEGCRALAGVAWDRGQDPAAFARQLAAVVAAPSRARDLAALDGLPTLVVHGTADPLVPPAAGRATARAIPGARLHLVQGMGHHLPTAAWPELVDAIAGHVLGAERAGATTDARVPVAAGA